MIYNVYWVNTGIGDHLTPGLTSVSIMFRNCCGNSKFAEHLFDNGHGVGIVDKIAKKKSKAVPLQAWSGPEGSRKLRFPDFMTTAQDGDKVVSLTHRPPLPPGNTPGTHFC